MADTSPFQKKHDQKELYSTIVAVVEVVALFKDCFEQTSNGVLMYANDFFLTIAYVIGQ